jgi:hypothetical protein
MFYLFFYSYTILSDSLYPLQRVDHLEFYLCKGSAESLRFYAFILLTLYCYTFQVFHHVLCHLHVEVNT